MRHPLWYWLRAVYVSRREYYVAVAGFAVVCSALWGLGYSLGWPGLQWAAYGIAGLGFLNFICTLIGLYRMYGPPSRRYYQRLVELGQLEGPVQIADVHVGTYRATWNFAELLPKARIHSVDIWDETIVDSEAALWDVRRLEAPTREAHERITFLKGEFARLPLEDRSVDAVTLGFGIHEVPRESLDQVFAEIRRVLKPGGRLLMYERGWSIPNYIVFGPGMFHFTRSQAWEALLERHFGAVQRERVTWFVDLFVCRNDGETQAATRASLAAPVSY